MTEKITQTNVSIDKALKSGNKEEVAKAVSDFIAENKGKFMTV